MKNLEILKMYLKSCLGVVGERKDIFCKIIEVREAIQITRKICTTDGKTYNLELTYTPEEFSTKPPRKKIQSSVDANVGKLLYRLMNPQS